MRLGLHNLRKGRGLLLGFLGGASGLSQTSHSKRQSHSRAYDQLSHKRDAPSKRFPVGRPSDVIESPSDGPYLPDPILKRYQPPVCIPATNRCNYIMTVCWSRSPRTFSFDSKKTGSLPSRNGPRHDRYEAHQRQCNTEDDHKTGGVGDETHERRSREHAEVADGRHRRHGEAQGHEFLAGRSGEKHGHDVREVEWVRMAPKARQAKGKARLNSYDKLLNEDVKEKEEKLEIFIPNGPRLGNKVIEAKHVAKAFGDKLLFDDLNFMLPPNGIVGIIGPNGAGKTTLFRLIMGLETPDSGEFEVGETVKVAYVDQQHKDIDPNKSVYQVISGGNDLIRMGGRDINARAYLSRFNFSGADQEKLCGVLSGGERNRLHLALCLKEEGNVLLLDEPTNDIDVNTLRALEEGLEDFAGCAVVISHDRWFLDRICTHILAFEGDSNVFFFEGSYSEYEENKLKRLGKEEPTRVRYRKLMND